MPSIRYSDLELALDFVAHSGFARNEAYVSRETGEIHWVSDDDIGEEVPDDLDDTDRYIPVPDKRDLDLGQDLVFRFARTHLPDHMEDVRDYFHKRGAYARFKDLLAREKRIDDWYAFEAEETKRALADWCREHGFDLVYE